MRNKKQCLKCKYHSYDRPTPDNVSKGLPPTKAELKRVICYYSVLSGKGPALKRNGSKEVIDSRGKDPNHCKLFEEGKPERKK